MARRHASLLLVVLVLAAGCSGAAVDGGGGSEFGASADEASTSGEAVRESESVESDDGGDGLARAQRRELVQTATVAVRVEDYGRARESLRRTARQQGGFVGDATSRRHAASGGNYTTGTVTYRVPADEFESFLATVNETGTVVRSERSTEDVTDRVVDLEARLDSLRTQRDRLRELYDDANDTSEVLAVERRLSDVQTEIERVEATRATLERRVAFSTVTVELREPRPNAPPAGAWYDTPLVEAFLASVDGVVVAVRAVAVVGAYALPYLFVFGTPPVVGVVLVWRRLSGSADEATPADAPPDDGGDGDRDDRA